MQLWYSTLQRNKKYDKYIIKGYNINRQHSYIKTDFFLKKQN